MLKTNVKDIKVMITSALTVLTQLRVRSFRSWFTASAGAMFWEDFDERVASLRPSATSSETSDAMMANLAEPLLPRTSDPLAWWRRCSPVYTSLSEVTKTRLCIVATSVPSEFFFSKTGQIISDRRTHRLSPSKVRELVFFLIM